MQKKGEEKEDGKREMGEGKYNTSSYSLLPPSYFLLPLY